MRTRPFLRSSEFLWQEGHTAHATSDEAIATAEEMLDVYADVVENVLAVPVVKGKKSAIERFAGADETYTIEALMPNGWALQSGTSHFLGQNFARAFDVYYQTKEAKRDLVWATSWGVSTRLLGALVMTHSDDAGLVLPPAIAPVQVARGVLFRANARRWRRIDGVGRRPYAIALPRRVASMACGAVRSPVDIYAGGARAHRQRYGQGPRGYTDRHVVGRQGRRRVRGVGSPRESRRQRKHAPWREIFRVGAERGSTTVGGRAEGRCPERDGRGVSTRRREADYCRGRGAFLLEDSFGRDAGEVVC